MVLAKLREAAESDPDVQVEGAEKWGGLVLPLDRIATWGLGGAGSEQSASL